MKLIDDVTSEELVFDCKYFYIDMHNGNIVYKAPGGIKQHICKPANEAMGLILITLLTNQDAVFFEEEEIG